MGCGGFLVLLIGIALVASTGQTGIIAAAIVLVLLWVLSARQKSRERGER